MKEESLKSMGRDPQEETTLTLHAIAGSSKKLVVCSFYRCQFNADDRNYAEKLGVDIENLVFLNLTKHLKLRKSNSLRTMNNCNGDSAL
jgi:hypothetical protein